MNIDLHSSYTWWWIGWIFYFVVLETVALIRKEPGDTLTEQVRFLFFAHPVFIGLVAALLAWLAYHFFVETWG